MKIPLSTIFGILLIGGAIILHFLKSEKTVSDPPANISPPHQFAKVYTRNELMRLHSKASFESPEKDFQTAQELVLASKEKPPEERRKDLMVALTILHDIRILAPSWETELVRVRSEQTVIAILDLQGNL